MRRVIVFALVLLLPFPGVRAGDLTPPGPPNDASSARYTLGDVLSRLSTGAAGVKRGATFVEPVAGPATATMPTTDQLMAAAPVADNTNGATTANVLAGKTFWGLRTDGTWGPKTGALLAQTPSASTTSQQAGVYAAFDLAVVDSDLATGNVRSGVSIFGVAGNPNVVNTSTGTAVAGEIVAGKKAWVAGTELTGSLAAQTPSAATTSQLAGVYAAFDLAMVDPDLATGNVRSGVTIFGVAGNPNVVNTSTGTAVAGDILIGRKAWVAGTEITGTGVGTYAAGVPRTWQKVCFDGSSVLTACPGTPAGQDGALQKGVPYPNPRFTDNGNGTVTDNLTSLIWLSNANCFGLLTWSAAMTSANSLASGACGLTDGSVVGAWRLPNVREQQSLIDYNYFNPAVPNTAGTGQWTAGNPFLSVQGSDYWTSSTGVGLTTYAWYVSVFYGNVSDHNKSDPHHVWPVRGGP